MCVISVTLLMFVTDFKKIYNKLSNVYILVLVCFSDAIHGNVGSS